MKQRLIDLARVGGHAGLAPLESSLLRRAGALKAPIFIIGAPRSGTSLFYELLVSRYRMAFFSNLAHRFYRTPAAASLMGRRAIANRSGIYSSAYGHIAGWTAPNEGGRIWARWMVDGPWVDERAAEGLAPEAMRATLAAHAEIFRAPFVNKNTMHANRIRLLDAIFPKAVFIEVRRDPSATVRSIVRAQRAERGPRPEDDSWWAVRPSNAAAGEDMLGRAVTQVKGVAGDIARDTEAIGAHRHMRIDYESVCRDPRAELDRTGSFLASHGFTLAEREEAPGGFPVSRSGVLGEREEERLAQNFP